jgi:hypothetical protein
MNATGLLPDAHRGPGVCAMRGGCGRKSPFDPELPCVDDGPADEVSPTRPPSSRSVDRSSFSRRPLRRSRAGIHFIPACFVVVDHKRSWQGRLGPSPLEALASDDAGLAAHLASESPPADPLGLLCPGFAASQTTPELRDLLGSVCGPSFDIPSTLCCTQDQVEALRDNLLQAEPCVVSPPRRLRVGFSPPGHPT